MDRQEFAKICEIIKAAHPKFEENINSKIKKQVWYEMIGDLEYDITVTAIKKVLSNNKFVPKISEIRQAVSEIKNPKNSMTGSEAWGQVRRAVRRHGNWNVEEALNSLDPQVRQLAKRFGFKDLCVSENIMADRAHFIKLWEQQQTKKKKYDALPQSVKENQQRISNEIKKLSNNFKEV